MRTSPAILQSSSSALSEEIHIALPGPVNDARTLVAGRAAELGLLDPTRIQAADDKVDIAQLIAGRYIEFVFEPAAERASMTTQDLIKHVYDDPYLGTYMKVVVGFVGRNVLPDLIPEAAAIGIVAWCWRNDTAVEAWHLPNDVLMARVNIAATKAVLPHVDPIEGIDWPGVERALTSDAWSLPSGQIVSELFGEGWPDVKATVVERLHQWRRVDADVLGPDATLRLLTVGGATSYTDRWWGQGRWNAMVRAVVTEAVAAGLALPAPYDKQGPDALCRNLVDPDQVSDAVLDWGHRHA